MIFVTIEDGNIHIVHAFIDGDGRRVLVDGSCYLALLQVEVWPTFQATTQTVVDARWCSSTLYKGG